MAFDILIPYHLSIFIDLIINFDRLYSDIENIAFLI